MQINGALGNVPESVICSTGRGILMAGFQGTALKDFILPGINSNDLLKKRDKYNIKRKKNTGRVKNDKPIRLPLPVFQIGLMVKIAF